MNNRDKTRTKEESQSLINDVINGAVSFCIEEYGYTENEAWEKVSDIIAYELEDPMNSNDLRPPTIEEEIHIASLMSQTKIIHLEEQ